MKDYWIDCISEGLCDAGVDATEKQIEVVADWAEGAHENYGMATGEDCIPNPVDAEVERLQKKIKALGGAHERQLDGIIKGVAQRRNVRACDVNISRDGLITYR
jgi:hypothetical protein